MYSRVVDKTIGNQEQRTRALELLGNKCSFPGCTWDHPDVIQIDHIIPVAISRSRIDSVNLCKYILKMEHPENEFQLLCANHHRLKTVRDLEDIREYRAEKSSLRQLDT